MTSTASDALMVGSAAGAFLGVSLFLIFTFVIIFYVLLVIADWKIFTKAGEKGWKSLIPFYNVYIVFKLFWETKWFWFTMLGAVVFGVLKTIYEGMQGDPNIIVALLYLAAGVFVLYTAVMIYYRMSKSFGHGAGFTIGLIFLPNIFTLILGFNKDKYKQIKD